MSGSMQEQQHLRLKNGLRVTLIHDPQATQAAALIQLAAGSHQEPGKWPGLAHLLEHVLFAGSHDYQGEQRLMAWAPAQGARLNATTLANQTAWFFEVAAPKLADGLRRLADMLAKPLLAEEAVTQEVAVIEAEYRMLTSHSDTLCEAALSQAFVAPHAFADFHVGNQARFGNDMPALRQALLAYHQRYFHPQNLQLWLHGPQSLTTLAALAEELGQHFATEKAASEIGTVPNTTQAQQGKEPQTVAEIQSGFTLSLRPERTFALQSSNTEQLMLSFPVTAMAATQLSLLQELLTDKATSSLLATLQEQGLCDDIRLLEPYRSPQQSLLSVVFQLSEASPEQGAAVEALFCRWLQLLHGITQQQLIHYDSLAQHGFARQPPLDQVRARAFGFPPDGLHNEAWLTLLAQLEPENMTRLWVSPQVNLPVNIAQGFTLKSGPIDWPAMPSGPWPQMAFYQPDAELLLPALPAAAAAIKAVPATGDATLLLSPVPGLRLEERKAAIMKAALSPLIAECRHRGGELNFSQQQGSWLLQLSGGRELLLYSLDKMLTVLNTHTEAATVQGERLYRQTQQALFNDFAVRCLLNRLPLVIQPSAADLHNAATDSGKEGMNTATSQEALTGTVWQAALYGGDEALHQDLARLLSRFPAELQDNQMKREPALPDLKDNTFATQSSDAAVIVFCPLPEINLLTLAAWQVLAALYEPQFFQRLRVEKNIGYVVSCRFHRTAGQAGILFALQSPTLQTADLYRHIDSFVNGMEDVVHAVTPEQLQEAILSLQNACPVHPVSSPAKCVEHWLHQQLNLPPLTREVYDQLRPEHLHQAQRYLSKNPDRCWHLNNTSAPSHR
ncbi:pyrroloquinoline quinone biosynthesis protein PqqF [Pantoea sp. BAV 3049]|uniref:pyrroloquinoline quinone biosynthesis protein PqqF n=1 Tax=Pantoea sp. BAV 3049 TaxID=2654188 RepID=UPI00131D16CE|nr:pyrroloquinoline quinone biosynthesis protein PqqF [Pantoea sp. BAV 3049]